MLIKCRRAEIGEGGGEALNTLEILFIISITFLFIFVGVIYPLTTLDIQNERSKSQIIENRLLEGCFSQRLTIVESERFTKEYIDTHCIQNIPENMFVKVNITEGETIFVQDSEEKLEEGDISRFCLEGSSVECFFRKYPIHYENVNNEKEARILGIQVIQFS